MALVSEAGNWRAAQDAAVQSPLCQLKHAEQPYLEREEVQRRLLGAGMVGGLALVWIGLRFLARAARRSIREIVRQELEQAGSRRP